MVRQPREIRALRADLGSSSGLRPSGKHCVTDEKIVPQKGAAPLTPLNCKKSVGATTGSGERMIYLPSKLPLHQCRTTCSNYMAQPKHTQHHETQFGYGYQRNIFILLTTDSLSQKKQMLLMHHRTEDENSHRPPTCLRGWRTGQRRKYRSFECPNQKNH